MLSLNSEAQYASPPKEEHTTIKLEPVSLSRRINENGARESKPKFWRADRQPNASPTSAESASPTSPKPLRAPTPGAVTPSTASSLLSRERRSSPTPDVEMERLSLERKAFTEEPPSPPANAPSTDIGKAARPISHSASPPLRSPAQVLRQQPQHQNHPHVSNAQTRKPKRVPHLITSFPSPRRHVSHPLDDKVYATSTQAHSAHPCHAGHSHLSPQPLSPADGSRPATSYEHSRAHGLPMPGSMSESVVSPVVRTSHRYSPYAAPPTAPPTPVRTGFILSPTTSVKGKHLVLVSSDMAEKMRRGGVIHFHSDDGREYHARQSEVPGIAENTTLLSSKKFKYQAADEAMDIEEDLSPASLSSQSDRDVRLGREVKERRSPQQFHPSLVDPVAAANLAVEREHLRERERLLAAREREMAERAHILQLERDYERVYEERQRHFAAHPYYPLYAEREMRPVAHAQVGHWDRNIDYPRADRHPIVYAARPPRSITPRGPPRSSSR